MSDLAVLPTSYTGGEEKSPSMFVFFRGLHFGNIFLGTVFIPRSSFALVLFDISVMGVGVDVLEQHH